MKLRKKKDKAWKKLIRQSNENNRKQYTEARNEYVRVRREEERIYEKDVVQKCVDEPKLFHKYVNGKMTSKGTIDKIIKEGVTYQTAEEISEIMNKSFKTVFMEEEEFTEPKKPLHCAGVKEITVQKEQIKKLLENLDVRKAMGPDGVACWVLKEKGMQRAIIGTNLGNCHQFTKGRKSTT